MTAGLLASSRAQAQLVTLKTRSIYRAFDLRLQPEIDRAQTRALNQFYQTLELTGLNLDGNDRVSMVVSLRYHTDFGTGFHRDTPDGAGVPAVDGRNDFDLMIAYVDWVALPELLELRFGRQLIVDDLDWYSLDGISAHVHPWTHGLDGLNLTVYAGQPVRFDVGFNSEALLGDGTEIYDGEAPFHGLTVGGQASLRLFRELSLSMSFRQEWVKRGDDLAVLFSPEDSARAARVKEASGGDFSVQESLLGAAVGYGFRSWHVDVFGSLTWNVLLGALEQARAGISYNPKPGLHFQAEYLRVRPRFVGDSIFNFFNIFGYDRARVEMTVDLFGGLRIEGGYFIQAFGGGEKGPKSTADPGPNEGASFDGSSTTQGPSIGVHYRAPRWSVGATLEGGSNLGSGISYGGNYRAAALFGDLGFWQRRLVLRGRLGLTSIQSDWFERTDSGEVAEVRTSYTASLAGRAKVTDRVGVRLNFIKNFDSYLEGGHRIYSELSVVY